MAGSEIVAVLLGYVAGSVIVVLLTLKTYRWRHR